MMTRHAEEPALKALYQAAWEAAGVTCVFQNAGEEGNAPDVLMKRLGHFTYATDLMPDLLMRAVAPAHIEAAKAAGKHCLYMSGNGVPLPKAQLDTVDEVHLIKTFFELGIRMMHLTYNRRNVIGDGCAESANGGLSDFGRQVVREMNRVGVIVDVAHAGWATCLDAARTSGKPIVASHSAAQAVNDHIRCKPDNVIRAIADTGGYIGICCISGFLGGSGGIDAFLDHIVHVARTFGAEHVGIGTDAGITLPGDTEGMDDIRRQAPRRRNRWESFWPEGTQLTATFPEASRQSVGWLNWPLFTVGLVQRGLSDGDIRLILGGNMLRVAQAVLPDPMRALT
jgi:membrane dipeptidase